MDDDRVGRGPRGLLLGLASALLPGAGQAGGGRPGLGALLALLWLVPVAVAAGLVAGAGASLGAVADAQVLAAVIAANAALLLARAVAGLHATTLGRAARGGGVAVVFAAVVVLGAVNAGVAWYTWQGYDTVTTVFAAEEPEVAEPVGGGVLVPEALPAEPAATTGGASTTGAASTTDEVATTGEAATTTADAAPAATAEPATTERPPATSAAAAVTARLEETPGPPWRRRGRVTVLLLGGDAGYGRSGLRTDTMIVATLDLRTGFAALFSVPRNTAHVPLRGPLADAYGDVYEPILNELYGDASGHPEWFPKARDPGAAALKQTLADLTGLPIDYYVLVDLKGFYEVVRAFGGVDVVVPERVLDRLSPPSPDMEWIRIDLEPGLQHLDAAQTFAYVRARSESSDWSRIKRQRCVLAALAAEATPGKVLRVLPGLLKTLRDNVTTDIPRDVLPDLVDLAAGLDRRHVLSFGFVPPDYTANGGPDLDAIHALVRSVVEHPAGKPEESAAGDACLSP